MKYIGESTSDEVILAWLKAEIESTRFSYDLGVALTKMNQNESIILAANLASAKENSVRRRILKTYRDWLTLDFDCYNWLYVELDQDDVKELQYIDYSYWNELSDNTRLVGKAVQNILKGKVVFDVSNDHFYSVAKEIESGKVFPPIILTTQDDDGFYEILEGHLRATSFLLAKETPTPLYAILGSLIESTGKRYYYEV